MFKYAYNYKIVSIYHEIDWLNGRTYCNLSLNEQLVYVNYIPPDITVCEKCFNVKYDKIKEKKNGT